MPRELEMTEKERLETLEEWIRSGRGDQARLELSRYSKGKVPRALALPLAGLSRRLGVPGIGIRLLNPLVRPTRVSPASASPEECAEYAALLSRIGANTEALGLLDTLAEEKCASALLYRAFALVAEWEYEASIPILERYVSRSELSDYQRLIGKVNLAAALVHGEHVEEAARLLDALLGETTKSGLKLLHGNCLELSAQNAILARRWKEAVECLARADRALDEAGGLDHFFVDKWRAISRFLKEGDAAARRGLRALREEAHRRRHWETARDCDYYQAIRSDDEELLAHLYFGTPFPGFRRRLVAKGWPESAPPERYRWSLGNGRGLVFLLEEGRAEKSRARLKPGQLLHRLLAALCSDFYRPLRIATLSARLFPGEYYNPLSSPVRVRQAVKRLRHWTRSSSVPFFIVETSSEYRLMSRKACAVIVSGSVVAGARDEIWLNRFKETHQGVEFSAEQVFPLVSANPRTVLRVLSKAVRDGRLRRVGAARATRYRFDTPSSANERAKGKSAR